MQSWGSIVSSLLPPQLLLFVFTSPAVYGSTDATLFSSFEDVDDIRRTKNGKFDLRSSDVAKERQRQSKGAQENFANAWAKKNESRGGKGFPGRLDDMLQKNKYHKKKQARYLKEEERKKMLHIKDDKLYVRNKSKHLSKLEGLLGVKAAKKSASMTKEPLAGKMLLKMIKREAGYEQMGDRTRIPRDDPKVKHFIFVKKDEEE